ncbi:hypothetical protein MRB53_006151 [Persea americana]|uniref:Uncharacterized protein n=1 Tax=Persea americana TaxID=3435 RepID=A0ACC2MFW0_PERAE|nr:hypothetical protein MRB53_006151 [Persea americana]
MCRSGAFVLGLADQTTCHSKEGSEKKDLDFTGREDFGVTALCSEKEGDVAASCNRFQPSSEQRRVQGIRTPFSRDRRTQRSMMLSDAGEVEEGSKAASPLLHKQKEGGRRRRCPSLLQNPIACAGEQRRVAERICFDLCLAHADHCKNAQDPDFAAGRRGLSSQRFVSTEKTDPYLLPRKKAKKFYYRTKTVEEEDHV